MDNDYFDYTMNNHYSDYTMNNYYSGFFPTQQNPTLSTMAQPGQQIPAGGQPQQQPSDLMTLYDQQLHAMYQPQQQDPAMALFGDVDLADFSLAATLQRATVSSTTAQRDETWLTFCQNAHGEEQNPQPTQGQAAAQNFQPANATVAPAAVMPAPVTQTFGMNHATTNSGHGQFAMPPAPAPVTGPAPAHAQAAGPNSTTNSGHGQFNPAYPQGHPVTLPASAPGPATAQAEAAGPNSTANPADPQANAAGSTASHPSRVTKRTRDRPNTKHACLNCQTKKAKCDGESPCHNCRRNPGSCEYADSKRERESK